MTSRFRARFTLLVAVLLCTVTGVAGAQSVADYNVNPLARVFAADSGQYGTRPSNAADGNTDPVCCSSFYHNGSGDVNGRRWWYVDLGRSYDITSLAYYFRSPDDCCPTQNDGNLLQLWTSTPTFGVGGSPLFTAMINYTGAASQIVDLSGAPISARYASVYAPAGSSFETIAFPELEVMGTVTAPEPASMGLLATGLVGIGALARRRRRSGTV